MVNNVLRELRKGSLLEKVSDRPSRAVVQLAFAELLFNHFLVASNHLLMVGDTELQKCLQITRHLADIQGSRKLESAFASGISLQEIPCRQGTAIVPNAGNPLIHIIDITGISERETNKQLQV